MTLSVKHAFTSAKGDPPDTTLVRPSNWNAEHTITMAADKVIGRASSSGAAQELDFSALAQTLAACTSAEEFVAALGIDTGFTTGDVKMTFKTTADSGWIIMNDGSIGDASSGATARANVDCHALFLLLWNNIADTWAPVAGGRGVSATADWAAHKKISLTKVLGRALAVAGSGSGLTTFAVGETTGEERHTLTKTEAPSGLITMTDPGHTHTVSSATQSGATFAAGGAPTGAQNTTPTTSSNTTGITLTDHGGDASHNNLQPTAFLNVMIKL